MLDLKLLRQNLPAVIANLAQRSFKFDELKFNALESERKVLQTRTQELQNTRNSKSKNIGIAKAKKDDATANALLAEVATLGAELTDLETRLEKVQTELNNYLLTVPNLLHSSVPVGKSEADNQVVREVGAKPNFAFKPKEHFELGEKIGKKFGDKLNKNMDFDASVKLSGARFVVLKDNLARLHRALAQFMLDVHTSQHGYTEVYAPLLVKEQAMYGTGQFPKFMDDQFGLKDSDLWLIPTSEVTLTNLVRDEIVPVEMLPLKYTCHSACFRKEAGSYGKDTKGMFRQHQFDKVELVQIVNPAQSYEALESLVSDAENILKLLKLPYRVMALCSADIGFGSAKTYDLEVWLPGQNCYREISSCSNTEAFQARRMQARMRVGTEKPELLHTLNGSGVAIGRALIAVLENYQDAAGNITVPEVLVPYMGGVTKIFAVDAVD
jgi:seryl-tRNA synthetase